MDQPAHAGGDPFQQIHDDDVHHEDVVRPIGIEQLVQQIKETADKLVRDRANRGDVKLLSTALKELRYCFKVFASYRKRRKVANALRELRYCFKVFASYRQRRKVTVFGSARLPLDHPACRAAVDFGQRMAHDVAFEEQLFRLLGLRSASETKCRDRACCKGTQSSLFHGRASFPTEDDLLF